MAVAAALIAGCGSSSSSSSSSPAGTSSSPAATSTPSTTSSSTTSSSTTPTAAAGGGAATIGTKKAKVGDSKQTILESGPKELTVYQFDADKGSKSACYGACAQYWPPVLTTGKPSADGAASSSMLGTTKRKDGTLQVTYNGRPLYYFVKDKDDEDTYGEGLKNFGAGWYVMRPNGHDIDLS
jgi:predicted lipoprotein with Yx(FWY)xxD motif